MFCTPKRKSNVSCFLVYISIVCPGRAINNIYIIFFKAYFLRFSNATNASSLGNAYVPIFLNQFISKCFCTPKLIRFTPHSSNTFNFSFGKITWIRFTMLIHNSGQTDGGKRRFIIFNNFFVCSSYFNAVGVPPPTKIVFILSNGTF